MLADMTDELQQVLRLLEGASVRPASCVAIVSDRGCSDESTMLGTRDSFLHLAHELVSFVARSDAARLRGSTEDDDAGEYDPERCEFSSGSIRRALYEFPSLRECTIVSALLVEGHDQLLARIREFLPCEVQGWEGDPQFDEPPFESSARMDRSE